MKTMLDRDNGRLDAVKEKISAFEAVAVETIQIEIEKING